MRKSRPFGASSARKNITVEKLKEEYPTINWLTTMDGVMPRGIFKNEDGTTIGDVIFSFKGRDQYALKFTFGKFSCKVVVEDPEENFGDALEDAKKKVAEAAESAALVVL